MGADWGGPDLHPEAPPRGPEGGPRARLDSRGMAVPRTLQTLVRTWRESGSPIQAPMRWPRDRWMARLPRHRYYLSSLPDTLDRATVRGAFTDAFRDSAAAERAFIAAMLWGYGDVGYGPWRVQRVLTHNRGVAAKLHAVALTLRDEGPLTAYSRLSSYTDSRLRYLGPAFGTKFLAFCSGAGIMRALILDRLVADWLAGNTDLGIDPVEWHPATYERYLLHMHEWADALDVQPDELECVIFTAEADRRDNQWPPAELTRITPPPRNTGRHTSAPGPSPSRRTGRAPHAIGTDQTGSRPPALPRARPTAHRG